MGGVSRRLLRECSCGLLVGRMRLREATEGGDLQVEEQSESGSGALDLTGCV